MATKSRLRIMGSIGSTNWPTIKDAASYTSLSSNMNAHELGFLLEGQGFHGNTVGSRKWAPNLKSTLTSNLPPKQSFNSILTPQIQPSFQDLKETLAHEISNHCSSLSTLHFLHAQTISFGLHQNLYICTNLITKYFNFGDIQSPKRVFNNLQCKPIKNLVWNSLIKGYLRRGFPKLALDVYSEMINDLSGCDPDKQTYHFVIIACTQLLEFELGFKVEECVRRKGMQSDVLIATALVNLYAKAGDTGRARGVFDGMAKRDVVAWNAMISGFSQCGFLDEAMKLLKDMEVRGILLTEANLVSVISGCGNMGLFQHGRAVHAHMVKIGFEDNTNASNSLMAMYIACDRLDMAEKLFNGMVLKDAISWSTMIGGYVEHECPHDALDCFRWMVWNTGIWPTRPILLSVLLACADLGDYEEGKLIKENYLVNEKGELISDAYLITALMYMYAKCTHMEIALQLLDEVVLVREDVVAWNAIMKACAERKQHNWVFELAFTMQRRGINPNAATFLTLLSTISSIPSQRKGKETHGQIVKRGFELERTIANCIIDMYARFGRIGDSCKVFNNIDEKDVVSWSSMIKAYAWNGCAKKALDLFQLMRKTEMRPNSITFLAVLSACCHAGFVNEGRELFESMEKEYELVPEAEHFTCMVDMFCRAGLLKEAYNLLKNKTREICSNYVPWGTLLSACRVHGDLVIGEATAQQLFLLEPSNAANYLMLADIYISAGRREEANGVLHLLREKGLEKRIGCSWFHGG